jgi:hypothetical protein
VTLALLQGYSSDACGGVNMMIVSSQGGKVFSTYYVVLSVDLINDPEK